MTAPGSVEVSMQFALRDKYPLYVNFTHLFIHGNRSRTFYVSPYSIEKKLLIKLIPIYSPLRSDDLFSTKYALPEDARARDFNSNISQAPETRSKIILLEFQF